MGAGVANKVASEIIFKVYRFAVKSTCTACYSNSTAISRKKLLEL